MDKTQWYWEIYATCLDEVFELLTCRLFEFGATGIQELATSNHRIDFKVFFTSMVNDPDGIWEKACEHYDKLADNFRIVSKEKKYSKNWKTSWKKYFKPIKIGKSFLVRPPWEKEDLSKKEIVINPGCGFGTGYHATTYLALQLLEWLGERHCLSEVIDVGTGSGVLTIAALLLNADKVTAIDVDQEALMEVPKNLRLSGLESTKCSLLSAIPEDWDNKADLVMANIEIEILSGLLTPIISLTKCNGYLIFSGILQEQKTVLLKMLGNGFTVLKELVLDDWYALILEKIR